MKETLRKRLLKVINRIDARIKMLTKFIQQYKHEEKYNEAMINTLKCEQLMMVSKNLKDLLD